MHLLGHGHHWAQSLGDEVHLGAHRGDTGHITPCRATRPPSRPHSRSERRILLYRAQALPDGPLSVLGLDVAPSTLLPFYDEDTGVVFLTGKVGAPAPRRAAGTAPRGVGPAVPSHQPPSRSVPG